MCILEGDFGLENASDCTDLHLFFKIFRGHMPPDPSSRLAPSALLLQVLYFSGVPPLGMRRLGNSYCWIVLTTK